MGDGHSGGLHQHILRPEFLIQGVQGLGKRGGHFTADAAAADILDPHAAFFDDLAVHRNFTDFINHQGDFVGAVVRQHLGQLQD